MDLSKYKKISIGGIEMKKLELDGTLIWKSGYKNWVPYSINADGSIYNGTGYKEGYRIRSGGAEGAQPDGVCTGFIPFKKGDIMRIYPRFSGRNTTNALNFSDAGFNNLGQLTDTDTVYGICQTNADSWRNATQNSGDITVVDLGGVANAGDVAYIRLSHFLHDGSATSVASGSELIVTINEEIT